MEFQDATRWEELTVLLTELLATVKGRLAKMETCRGRF